MAGDTASAGPATGAGSASARAVVSAAGATGGAAGYSDAGPVDERGAECRAAPGPRNVQHDGASLAAAAQPAAAEAESASISRLSWACPSSGLSK